MKHGDATALTKALCRVLEDDAFRERLSAAAAEDARGRFDIRRQATEYLNWYTEWREDRDHVRR